MSRRAAAIAARKSARYGQHTAAPTRAGRAGAAAMEDRLLQIQATLGQMVQDMQDDVAGQPHTDPNVVTMLALAGVIAAAKGRIEAARIV